MREGLIEDLEKIKDAISYGTTTIINNYAIVAKTMQEAIDELKKYQMTMFQRENRGIFLSGNDVANQIQKDNENRRKQGMPPV
jgi:cytidylate kinase